MSTNPVPISLSNPRVLQGPGPAIDFKHIVSETFKQIPGVVGAGFVDLRRGDFVELETIGSHPRDFLAYLAAATKTYFEGDSVKTIQAVLHEASNERSDRKIEEVIVRSSRFIHIFQRLTQRPDLVLAVVAQRDTKVGLAQAVIRRLVSPD